MQEVASSEMEVHAALKEQYHASLAMLRECVQKCPDELWLAGRHPRTTWRIAFHAVFYTHLYLGQNEEAFVPWAKNRAECRILWNDDREQAPPGSEPYSRAEILEYVDHVDSLVDATVDGLDLESPETGFPWYPDMSKLSHELMNLRHLQGHVGQISELLMARGIDTHWIGKCR